MWYIWCLESTSIFEQMSSYAFRHLLSLPYQFSIFEHLGGWQPCISHFFCPSTGPLYQTCCATSSPLSQILFPIFHHNQLISTNKKSDQPSNYLNTGTVHIFIVQSYWRCYWMCCPVNHHIGQQIIFRKAGFQAHCCVSGLTATPHGKFL